MLEAPATFVWAGGALVEQALRPHDELLVADSWYVSDSGRARAIDAHRERFLASVDESAGGVAAGDAEAFWGAAIARLRAIRTGALFPRVELARIAGISGAVPTTSGGRLPDGDTSRSRGASDRPGDTSGVGAAAATPDYELRLRVRAAPRLRETAVLSTYEGPDPRRVPRVKGPDLERLLALRATAQENGADEVALLHDGYVVDGSSSALLWWRGETLVAPASDLARVPSVTARSIRLIATATGTRVVEERARPADLEGCELWIVSALHGITVVEVWIDGPVLEVRPSRAATWRKRLDALSRPL
ncbi:aminotransferase class IV [Herbiconiux ginsengi]|uniref:Amino-transferase class IV n=1 Tax=Herbiconiux ginsengi TaxID=381665 RepID=A0A1H3T1R4_9MICO|nr:aminotransferase class IV [Herbiconiux ginsengi]SDZ43897.1 Amino-transferase class IV [Herbiconiux ginsengi]